VQTREGNEVHCQFAEVRVQLTREPQAASYTTHGGRDQMVQITNCQNKKIDVNKYALEMNEKSRRSTTEDP